MQKELVFAVSLVLMDMSVLNGQFVSVSTADFTDAAYSTHLVVFAGALLCDCWNERCDRCIQPVWS